LGVFLWKLHNLLRVAMFNLIKSNYTICTEAFSVVTPPPLRFPLFFYFPFNAITVKLYLFQTLPVEGGDF
jgi:hypothetical protein